MPAPLDVDWSGTVAIVPLVIDAPEGFEAESTLMGPEQIILASYGPAFDEHGREREPTTEEETEREALRADIRARQLHRWRISLTDWRGHAPGSGCHGVTHRAMQSPLFTPAESGQMAHAVARAAQECMAKQLATA